MNFKKEAKELTKVLLEWKHLPEEGKRKYIQICLECAYQKGKITQLIKTMEAK